VDGDKGKGIKGGLALAGATAVAIALLAGCAATSTLPGPGSANTGPASPGPAGTGKASVASTTGAAPGTGGAAAGGGTFVPIEEPFDPGHPARVTATPASCGSQQTTLEIEKCFEGKAETADAAINNLRQASFDRGSAAQRATINAEDSAWLTTRGTVCRKAYQSGGTIDGINIASCLLDESTARLRGLHGTAIGEAVLKSTDSTNPSDLSWYTTPAGSRIAMTDTQGDASGGVIISWVIIAGADGFVVNPAQFSYRDGSFSDQGTVQGASPAGHRVAPGAEYQFTIDYSTLQADPNTGKEGGWVYAPGYAAAVWR
jgi:uncharacterized protein YecT (DUF1311 family)